MEPIGIIIGISALIITILIALIPYFRKVYFVGPELTIELLANGGSSSSKGLSNKNDFSKGSVNSDKAIHIFELNWNISLKITNNSNLTAYYPELKFIDEKLGFTTLEKLDINTPIKENEQIVLKGTFTMYNESTGSNRMKIKGLPEHLKDLKILLKYKNPSKNTFYTIFNNSEIKYQNKYTRKKPKEFNNNNR